MVTGFLFIMLGIILVLFKHRLGISAASLYRKLGVDVPGDSYARQFMFIGIVMMVVGFMAITGIWHLI